MKTLTVAFLSVLGATFLLSRHEDFTYAVTHIDLLQWTIFTDIVGSRNIQNFHRDRVHINGARSTSLA